MAEKKSQGKDYMRSLDLVEQAWGALSSGGDPYEEIPQDELARIEERRNLARSLGTLEGSITKKKEG